MSRATGPVRKPNAGARAIRAGISLERGRDRPFCPALVHDEREADGLGRLSSTSSNERDELIEGGQNRGITEASD